MLRKICSIGNSQGVSLPKEILKKLDLEVGSQVGVELDEKRRRIIIEAKTPWREYGELEKEFVSQVNDFIRKYKPALKALAKK
ncbi:MAG: AbrB/MazE/SpoVT family DNA-binding domain-containing protein [Thermodesulfobacteriota bacterium]